jgi:NodT family efflux transporter outer membrane factor (OMF) lipoprotein
MLHCATTNPLRRFATALAALAGLAGLAVAGCVVGPNFPTPPALAVNSYVANQPAVTTGSGAGVAAAQAFHPGTPLPQDWWHAFGSVTLDALVERAVTNSPDVAQSQARLLEAQASMAAESGATRFPSVDGTASAARQRVYLAGFGIPNAPTPAPFDLYNVSVNASYSLDLFGGNHRVLEGLAAQVDYQYFELSASRLTLAANVVTAAIRRASIGAQIAATNELLLTQQRQLQIMQTRHALGGISEQEARDQRRLLAQTQATLPLLEKQRDQLTHQLAVYAGWSPAEAKLPELALADLHLPVDLPLVLPAELARERPDIRAAEALWHAACAQVGVATANLFPKLNLTASAGSERLSPGQLANSLNVWSLGSQAMQPLFHGGQLRANRRAAEAAYDAAGAGYRVTVLLALQQVADSLAALDADARALQAQTAANDESEANFEIAQQRYSLGGISEWTLLDAERQRQQTRISRFSSVGDRYADTAALFHALGGWKDARVSGLKD